MTVPLDADLLQTRWDAQQTAYLPDREARFTAMLDTVEAATATAPRILDLAGGTGSITRRVLARWPDATAVVLDVDPALLAIAAATFSTDARVEIKAADLATGAWAEDLAPASFDAVLTATALHWLPAERVAGVYREAAVLLRPGGVLINADHHPDEGLASLRTGLDEVAARRTQQLRARTGASDWAGWWDELRQDPDLAEAVAARDARFAERSTGTHVESTLAATWHLAALRDAGFAETGLVWRGLNDAAVCGRSAI
jgi:SAM-dependent methyltransferase